MAQRYTKLVHITFSPELLQALDVQTKQLYVNRSEFIRQAVIDKLRDMQPQPAKPTTKPRIDLMMTDQQLTDTRDALNGEIRRRHYNKWHRT